MSQSRVTQKQTDQPIQARSRQCLPIGRPPWTPETLQMRGCKTQIASDNSLLQTRNVENRHERGASRAREAASA